MKKAVFKRIMASIVIFVLILMGLFFLALEIKNKNNTDTVDIQEQKVKSMALEDDLSQRINFNSDIYLNSSHNEKKLADDITLLGKKQFKGLYVGIKKQKVVFSGSLGYANAKNKSSFKFNSSFLVGKYQDFLNNALIIKLLQRKKLNLNTKLATYLPSLADSKGKTLHDFLYDGSDYYVKLDKLSMMPDTSIDLKKIKSFKRKPPEWTSASNLIKMQLIAKSTGESYEKALNKWLFTKLGLQDTRFYDGESMQANDVIGYKYLKQNGSLIQQNMVSQDRILIGENQLKMSISDIILSNIKILNNNYFEKKYNTIFYRMNNIANVGSEFNSNYYKLTIDNSGQRLFLIANSSGTKLVISATNFPNKDISVTNEAKKMFNLIN